MKYRTYSMLAQLARLANLHRIEMGTRRDSAWFEAEHMLNGDPCDDWPIVNIGGEIYITQEQTTWLKTL